MSANPALPNLVNAHALFAFEALRAGPVYTLLYETGSMLSEQVCWPSTRAAHRHLTQSLVQETKLLLGLPAAASLGLARMRLQVQPGDPSTYLVRWERAARA